MNRYFTFTGDNGGGERRVVVFFGGETIGRSHWPRDPVLGSTWTIDEMEQDFGGLFTEVNEQRARFILGRLPTKGET
jgi:hypothetical protein